VLIYVSPKIYPSLTQSSVSEALGEAIGKIYRTIYLQNKSKKYPSPEYRLMSTMAGCLSFFYKLHKGLPEKWIMWFLATLLKRSDVSFSLISNKTYTEAEDIINRINEIHRNLQEEHLLMNVGMKPLYGYFLVSNFQQSQEEQLRHRNKLEKMVGSFELFKDVE
jgi:hypothetical protein